MAILNADGSEAVVKLPKVAGVHPFGSKILIECLGTKEIMGTDLVLNEDVQTGDAPQAYIVELGPNVPEDAGLSVGQRIYWEGKGMGIEDPRTANNRVRAILEIHNIRAIIEEE